MRFQNLKQLAKGINGVSDGTIRSHALAELERAKWRFWNGQTIRGLIGLVHLGHWARARSFEHIPALVSRCTITPDSGSAVAFAALKSQTGADSCA
jgi:hypothetical protein